MKSEWGSPSATQMIKKGLRFGYKERISSLFWPLTVCVVGHCYTWSHSMTQSGFLWTGDQPDAETNTQQQTTFTRDRHPCSRGIRTRNPRKRAAVDPRLPHGRRDRLEGRSWTYIVTECDIPMKLARIIKSFKWNIQQSPDKQTLVLHVSYQECLKRLML
jgi:hypothetical protein